MLTAAQLAEWEQSVTRGTESAARGQHTEAITHFQNALHLDDHFAELHFRLARSLEGIGRLDQAQTHYGLARDWDALQFRADHRLNQIIRQVATNFAAQSTTFVDSAAAIAKSPIAGNGIPGENIFHEHVHFTFDGDYQLAKSLLPEVIITLKLEKPVGEIPTRQDCASTLAYTDVDDMNVRTAMALQTSKPPFIDQLEHSARQSALDQQNKERLAPHHLAGLRPRRRHLS